MKEKGSPSAESKTADTIDIKAELAEINFTDESNISSGKEMNPDDLQEYERLLHFDGFKEIDHFKKGKIYQNNNNVFKVTHTLNYTQSSRNIFELLTHFDHWNTKVKEVKMLQTMEKGVYKMAIFFHRTGCFTK